MKRVVVNILLVLLIGAISLDFQDRRLTDVGFFERTERILYDVRLGYLAEPKSHDNIVIIDIDEASLDQVGRWPWRRDVIGRLIERLVDEHKVRMVLTNLQFADPDLTGPQIMAEIRERFEYDLAVQFAIDSIESDYDFDDRFSQMLDGKSVLLGYAFTASDTKVGTIPPPSVLFDQERKAVSREVTRSAVRDLVSYEGYVGNLRQIMASSLASGHVTPVVDQDGIVRRVPLMIAFRGVPYEALGLTALRYDAGQMNPEPVRITRDDGVLSVVSVGDRDVPINRDGTIYLNYHAREEGRPGAFRYVSAGAVLDEAAQADDTLRDRIAIIGSSSVRVSDNYATPLDPDVPGVELLATFVAGLLDGDLLYRPTDLWVTEAAMYLLLGVLLAVALPFLNPLLSVIAVAAVSYGVLHLNLQFWQDDQHVYQLFPFIVMIVVLFVWSLSIGFVIEYRSTRQMGQVMGQYLPPALARRMTKSKRSITDLKGEEKELSILFSDVRGFTSISERLDPQDLSLFMNRMLTALSERIHAHGGTIDKYIGDAVMAFWGAPLDDPEHARHSVMAALEMQAAIGKLSDSVEKQNLPPLRMGVGICTGHARVGNMGSNIRLNYTVMGDSVNTASRLEGITKYYDVPIVVSDRTAESIPETSGIVFREVDTIRVKGKEQPIRIYQPLGLRSKLTSYIVAANDEYHEALVMYKNKDFENSLAVFRQLGEQFPSDGLVQTYISRIEDILKEPVPPDWEPIWNFVTK